MFTMFRLFNSYGDIVPRTKLGKSLMLIYMSLATLLIAALTGVYTERVANAEMNLSPENKVKKKNELLKVLAR